MCRHQRTTRCGNSSLPVGLCLGLCVCSCSCSCPCLCVHCQAERCAPANPSTSRMARQRASCRHGTRATACCVGSMAASAHLCARSRRLVCSSRWFGFGVSVQRRRRAGSLCVRAKRLALAQEPRRFRRFRSCRLPGRLTAGKRGQGLERAVLNALACTSLRTVVQVA